MILSIIVIPENWTNLFLKKNDNGGEWNEK